MRNSKGGIVTLTSLQSLDPCALSQLSKVDARYSITIKASRCLAKGASTVWGQREWLRLSIDLCFPVNLDRLDLSATPFRMSLFPPGCWMDGVLSRFMSFQNPHNVILFGNRVITRVGWAFNPMKNKDTGQRIARTCCVTREGVRERFWTPPAEACQGLLPHCMLRSRQNLDLWAPEEETTHSHLYWDFWPPEVNLFKVIQS